MSNFELAKVNFLSTFSSLTENERKKFIVWIRESELLSESSPNPDLTAARTSLLKVADDLRAVMKRTNNRGWFSGVHRRERIFRPDSGFELDAFLVDIREEEMLKDEGIIPGEKCLNCGSTNVEPVNYVSHSFAASELEFIFAVLLPDLTGKSVLDVGSRLGAVLFGAFYFSSAKDIIGVEMDEDFCRIAGDMAKKHGMAERVKIHHENVLKERGLLKEADAIILNNVFEWFVDGRDEKARIWEHLRGEIKPGCLLVTVPSLEESIRDLPVKFTLSEWVEPMKPHLPDSVSLYEDVENIFLYRVVK